MSEPLTDRQRANLAAILEKAKILIDANKAEAVKSGDISLSIGIANRQAQIESYFRAQGVETP